MMSHQTASAQLHKTGEVLKKNNAAEHTPKSPLVEPEVMLMA